MTAIDMGYRDDLTPPERGAPSIDPLQFHSAILASVGQAIVAVTLDRTIVYWNREAEVMFGWTAEEAVGRTSTELLLRGRSAERASEIVGSVERNEGWSGELEVERRDGTRLWVYVTNRPIYDAAGEVVAIVGSSIDVSARRTEDAARRQLSSIVDSSADAIFGVTLDGVITSWNHAAENLFGYSAAEIVGQFISVIAPDDLRYEQLDARTRLSEGSPFEVFETTRQRKDGSLVDVLLTASRTNDEHGHMTGSSVIARHH